MSKKRLLAIIVWFAALATTGAIADVTHTPLDGANPGAATQRDAEEVVTRRLLDQFRTIKIPLIWRTAALRPQAAIHNRSLRE